MNGFSLWLGLGATVGLWRVSRSAPPQQTNAWTNAGLLVLAFTLIGARLFYVFENHSYFFNHWIDTIQIWQGGLAWPGAFAGAALGIFTLALMYRGPSARNGDKQAARPRRIPLGWIGDRLYPLLPTLAITTWLGSWQAGVAYGSLLPSGTWWGVPSLDDSGVYNLHVPLQPLAALSLLLFFWLLETRVKPIRPPGRLSALAVLGLLLHTLVTSLFRADPAPYWNGLRTHTCFAIFYLAAFITFLVFNTLLPRVWKRPGISSRQRFSS